MQTYEIRILNDDLTTKVIVAQQYIGDHAAIRSARQFAEPRAYEVWRGLACIYAANPQRPDMVSPRRPQTAA